MHYPAPHTGIRKLFTLLAFTTWAVSGMFLFGWQTTEAYEQRSYDVYTLPVMYLDEGIDETVTVPTSTDSIRFAQPKINGSGITPKAMSGAIFEFRLGSDKEDVYSSRVIVDSNNEMTLTGSVIRDICQYTEERSFTGCGNALKWPRGTEIRLSNNHRVFNLKADIDRRNAMRGSGSFASNQTSQPFLFYKGHTQAQIDAYTYAGESGEATVTYNITDGVLQWSSDQGLTWLTLATQTGSFANASTVSRGVVCLANSGSALTGSGQCVGGAINVLPATLTTSSGGYNVADDGYIPVLSGAFLDESLTGTGPSSGKYLQGSAYGPAKWVTVGEAPTGSILMWTTDTAPEGWILCDGSAHTRTGTGGDLFSVLGTTYGVGDGSTTFNVPDMRGRFPLGQDDMGGNSANRVTDYSADLIGLSGSGGTATKNVSHTHSLTATQLNKTSSDATPGTYGFDSNSETIPSGGSSTQDIMPPYLTINFIIKN